MNWRLWGLIGACLVVMLTFLNPKVSIPRPIYRYLFVIDITQSMNAEDYHIASLPADRLGFVKESIRQIVRDLPCGSEVGLGLFTTQNTQLLFEPLEACEHLAVFDEVLSHVDWRMAWAANSMIPQGLYSALRILQERYPGVRLVFFTDGQNAPPQTFKPNFTGHPGEVAGLIVGVGGGQPTLVPKYDRENHRIGYWENTEIAEMEIAGSAARNTNGPISPSNSGRTPESFAPLSGEHEPPSMTVPQPGYYQSWLDETHLLELSVITGLRYHRLESPDVLSQALHGSAFAESRIQLTDIRGFLALLALVLVLTGYWRRGPRIRRTSIYSRSAYRSAPEQRTTRP